MFSAVSNYTLGDPIQRRILSDERTRAQLVRVSWLAASGYTNALPKVLGRLGLVALCRMMSLEICVNCFVPKLVLLSLTPTSSRNCGMALPGDIIVVASVVRARPWLENDSPPACPQTQD